MIEDSPARVIIAGDWHGNAEWARHVIGMAGRLLPGEAPRLILHLGDFGIWPGESGREYVSAVSQACLDNDALVRFIDGNHEDFTQLEGLRVRDDSYYGGDAPVAWLPRGHRWQWHGRTWLALGGAVSLDRPRRIPGVSWWAEEEITRQQAQEVIDAGPADVMLTHDCPARVSHEMHGMWPPEELRRSDVHRDRLQRVVDKVKPGWLFHGHLHRAYTRHCNFGYGPVRVTGLDCDGGRGINYDVVDVRDMSLKFS